MDPNNFSATVYVRALWESKALQYFDQHANPVDSVLATLAKNPDVAGKRFGHRAGDESSPWTFAVRGSGTIESVNMASHHGEMIVSVGPRGHAIAVTLQIGPVVYGTAVRDSLPFISFGDFVNQIQYAQVSKALNDRAVALASDGITPRPQKGQTVEFVGAMADPATSGGTTITPVRLHLAKVSLR